MTLKRSKADITLGGGQQLLVRATSCLREAKQTVRVGDACAAQGRSHRVSVADPTILDPAAVFLFVAASEWLPLPIVQATPFDVPDAFWGDRGDKRTFDVMIEGSAST